ncbi:hypothetical protein B0H10DRAFT_1955639 [Mycena sp. CBHHK59/15]|nr:hypothetical protein B0H10DRAFT_1955639 [Mycena sp. CBHHK59/15]
MLAAKIPQWKHHERRGQALFKLIADLQVEFAAQFEAARLETNRKAREKRGTARTAAGKAGMSESDDGDDEDGEAAMQSDGADCDFAEDQEVPIAAPKPTGKRRAPFDDATNVPRAANAPAPRAPSQPAWQSLWEPFELYSAIGHYSATRILQAAVARGRHTPSTSSTHAVRLGSGSASRDALYESTTVLETMHVGSVMPNLGRVEEGGVPTLETLGYSDSESFDLISEALSVISGSSEERSDSNHPEGPCGKLLDECPHCWKHASKPIGDLHAFLAAAMLHAAQPFPGDFNPCSPGETQKQSRFLLYTLSSLSEDVVEPVSLRSSGLKSSGKWLKGLV